MNLGGFDIGVCSWSLRANDNDELIRMMREAELSHLHLSLNSLIALSDEQRTAQIEMIRNAGITITAGMIGFPGEDYSTITRLRQTGGFAPDDFWPERRELTALATGVCREFDIKLLSTHVGFIPPSSDEKYPIMVDRVSEVAADMATQGRSLLLESGQWQASEFLQFLNDVRSRNVFVNFDPANMILYGSGDPVEAIQTLGRHIRHVHVKDAKESQQPGTKWGEEVAFGTGEVQAIEFINALRSVGYMGPLVIEREAGASREKDIRIAVETLRKVLTDLPSP